MLTLSFLVCLRELMGYIFIIILRRMQIEDDLIIAPDFLELFEVYFRFKRWHICYFCSLLIDQSCLGAALQAFILTSKILKNCVKYYPLE